MLDEEGKISSQMFSTYLEPLAAFPSCAAGIYFHLSCELATSLCTQKKKRSGGGWSGEMKAKNPKKEYLRKLRNIAEISMSFNPNKITETKLWSDNM